MVLIITVKEITFWNVNLIYAIRNVLFTFDFKKISENDLISETFTSRLKKLEFSLFSGIFSEVKNI